MILYWSGTKPIAINPSDKMKDVAMKRFLFEMNIYGFLGCDFFNDFLRDVQISIDFLNIFTILKGIQKL